MFLIMNYDMRKDTTFYWETRNNFLIKIKVNPENEIEGVVFLIAQLFLGKYSLKIYKFDI